MSYRVVRKEYSIEPPKAQKSLTSCPVITFLALAAIAALVTGGVLYHLNAVNNLTSISIMAVGGIFVCLTIIVSIMRIKCGDKGSHHAKTTQSKIKNIGANFKSICNSLNL